MSVIRQAIILAGGRGTRLGGLTKACPKPLLSIAGTPFVVYIINKLKQLGITHIVISECYLAHKFRKILGDGEKWGIRIKHVEEPVPFGTGGAIAWAKNEIFFQNESVLVCNGDTYVDLPPKFLEFPLNDYLCCVLLRPMYDFDRYGVVDLDLRTGLVQKFYEKTYKQLGIISCGVYILPPHLDFSDYGQKFSFEEEFLPDASSAKKVCGYLSNNFFIDMGTQKDFSLADDIFKVMHSYQNNPALFVDRDGTLIYHINYLHKKEDVKFIPGVIEGLKRAHQNGFKIIMVSNQSGVGRGYFTKREMENVNEFIKKELEKKGVYLSGIYCCPHSPDDVSCSCRKPSPRLVLTAIKDNNLCLRGSYFIGDNLCDIFCGINSGITPILVRTGLGPNVEKQVKSFNVLVVDDMKDAVDFILKER